MSDNETNAPAERKSALDYDAIFADACERLYLPPLSQTSVAFGESFDGEEYDAFFDAFIVECNWDDDRPMTREDARAAWAGALVRHLDSVLDAMDPKRRGWLDGPVVEKALEIAESYQRVHAAIDAHPAERSVFYETRQVQEAVSGAVRRAEFRARLALSCKAMGEVQ